MADQIYVALLDEGVDVWRPVPAKKVKDSVYTILKPRDYDPDDEKWEFPPGTTVECETRALPDGVVLAAIRAVKQARRTA